MKKAISTAAVVLLLAGVASAQVTAVQANLFTGVADVQFDGTTLSVDETSTLDLVTVLEAGPTSGFSNMTLHLDAEFDSVALIDTFVWGKFINGNVSLTFDSYELSGPIDVLLVKIDNAVGGATPFAQLSAEGLFEAVVANLPANPTGGWPQMAPLQSSLKGLIFEVGQDLTSYQWNNPEAWTGESESNWQFIPDDSAVPEPASLLLVALGGVAILRRR